MSIQTKWYKNVKLEELNINIEAALLKIQALKMV